MVEYCLLLLTFLFYEIPAVVAAVNRSSIPTYYNGSFGSYHIVRPLIRNNTRLYFPNSMRRPSYYKWGMPAMEPSEIIIKTRNQIMKVKRACKLARYILNEVGKSIRIGNTTEDIDKMVHRLAIYYGAYPSPLNYWNFPKSVCTSVNNVACHGIPDTRALRDGDIISVDVAVYLDGFHGDCADTFLVGNVDEEGRRLVEASREALYAAIAICKPGEYFRNIGNVTEQVAKRYNYSIVKTFTGHGIGNHFHESPTIFHFYYNEETYIHNEAKMEPGMIFTIEPLLAQGNGSIKILRDHWTSVTEDWSRAAQWEQTLVITQTGVEILTV